MKLTLQAIEDLIRNIIGEDVIPLVKILYNRENVSEFKLAEMLNITVNQVRNMLYRLYEQNLVFFIRKKDKKKGWYIYYWSPNLKGTENAILKTKIKQLDDLKVRLTREQESQFYVCPNSCIRFPIETAMEYEFKCQECGALMKELENKKTIDNIKNMVINLEAEIESLKNPIPKKVKGHKPKKEKSKKTIKKFPKKFFKKPKKSFKKPIKKVFSKLKKRI